MPNTFIRLVAIGMALTLVSNECGAMSPEFFSIHSHHSSLLFSAQALAIQGDFSGTRVASQWGTMVRLLAAFTATTSVSSAKAPNSIIPTIFLSLGLALATLLIPVRAPAQVLPDSQPITVAQEASLTWQLEARRAVLQADQTVEAAKLLNYILAVENGQAFLDSLEPTQRVLWRANADFHGSDPLGLGAESLASIEPRLDDAFDTVEAVNWPAAPASIPPVYTFGQRLRHSADVLANPLRHWKEKYRLIGIPLPMHIHALTSRLAPHPGYRGRRDQIELMWNRPKLEWEALEMAWHAGILASQDLTDANDVLLQAEYAENQAREKIEPGLRLRDTYKAMGEARDDASQALSDLAQSPESKLARAHFLNVQAHALSAREAFLSELSPEQRHNFEQWESAQIKLWMAWAQATEAALWDAAAARQRQKLGIDDQTFDELFGQPHYIGSPRRAQTPSTFPQKLQLPRINIRAPLREHLRKMLHPKGSRPYFLGAA